MTQSNETMTHMSEYRASIDELHFSEEAKKHVASRIARAATQEQATQNTVAPVASRHKRHLPFAAAIFALTLALGAGGIAYAAGGFMNVPQFVQHLFGRGGAKVEVIDRIGRPVNIAQSVDGVTVSVDAIIGDKTNVAVVFSVSKDDGTPFDIEALDNGYIPMGFSEDMHVNLPPLSGWGATGSSYFYDEDPSDNAIQLVETRIYESDSGLGFSLVGRTMTVHLSDLTYYGEDGPKVLATGNWDFSFPLNYEDTSVELPSGQSFEVNGIHATINSLSISPIALHMVYTADQKVEWTSGGSGRLSEHDSKLQDSLLGVRVSLTMNDGTVVEAVNSGGGRIGEKGDFAECETGIFWDRVLDLSEVACVTIGGTTIAL